MVSISTIIDSININPLNTVELALVAALVAGYVAVMVIRLRKRWRETTHFTKIIILASSLADTLIVLALGGMVFEAEFHITFHTRMFLLFYFAYKLIWLVYHIAEIVEERPWDGNSKLG